MLLINISGVLLIALIVWWFWLYKPQEIEVTHNKMVIRVENGVYTPAHIKVKANKSTLLTFIRADSYPCAATLLIPGLEMSKEIPLNKETVITLPPLAAGEYPFHCPMQMYRGVIKSE
jgi:plastocyanin domain-containing protein